jgi:hypothetical protein
MNSLGSLNGDCLFYLSFLSLWGQLSTLAVLSKGYRGRGISSGVKRHRREADHTPVTNVEVKENMDLYIHSPYVFMVQCLSKYKDNLDSFTFLTVSGTLPLFIPYYLIFPVRSAIRTERNTIMYILYSVWCHVITTISLPLGYVTLTLNIFTAHIAYGVICYLFLSGIFWLIESFVISWNTSPVFSDIWNPSGAVVFSLSCSRTPRCHPTSTLYPLSCWCIIEVMYSL